MTDARLPPTIPAHAMRTEPATGEAAGPVKTQICARCDQPTSTPVTIAIVHSASVGGRTIYACPGKCAESFPKQRDHGRLMSSYRRIGQRR